MTLRRVANSRVALQLDPMTPRTCIFTTTPLRPHSRQPMLPWTLTLQRMTVTARLPLFLPKTTPQSQDSPFQKKNDDRSQRKMIYLRGQPFLRIRGVIGGSITCFAILRPQILQNLRLAHPQHPVLREDGHRDPIHNNSRIQYWLQFCLFLVQCPI